MRIIAILCLHMKQDKGHMVMWAVLKCTFLSYVTRPSARLTHKNTYTWGM